MKTSVIHIEDGLSYKPLSEKRSKLQRPGKEAPFGESGSCESIYGK